MPYGKRRGTGWPRLEAAADALYSVLERAGRNTGVHPLAKNGPERPLPAGRARRLISMGGKGRRVSREYQAGFGWHSLFLYVSLPVVMALALAPKELIERIPGVPHSYAQVDAGALILVSARATHREAVVSTAQPRGYSVIAVKSAKAALDALAGHASTLRFVVIDRDLAGTAALRAAVQEESHAARVVLLPESATPAEIANQLIQAGLR